MKKDRPRSTQRRALRAALLSGVLGVAAIASSVASATPTARHDVKTLAGTAAATATFPSTTSTTSTTSTSAPTTTAPVAPATAPAPTAPPDVAAALRYLAAAQPAPTPPPADPAPAPATSGSVEDAIATYFGDVYDKAVRVARCESSLDPNAVSAGGGNYGLFQINQVHRPLVESMGYSWDQIFDPYVNAAVARQIYDGSGWSPWGCRYA